MDLNESQKNIVLNKVLKYANKIGRIEFEMEVIKTFSLEDESSNIEVVYESLRNDCPKWSEYFRNEIIRGI